MKSKFAIIYIVAKLAYVVAAKCENGSDTKGLRFGLTWLEVQGWEGTGDMSPQKTKGFWHAI